MYKGAKYIGIDKIKIGKTGEILSNGDVTTTIPEQEAKGRKDFEPVYEGSEKKKKKDY